MFILICRQLTWNLQQVNELQAESPIDNIPWIICSLANVSLIAGLIHR